MRHCPPFPATFSTIFTVFFRENALDGVNGRECNVETRFA
jgi:hypothetical protein